MNADQAYGFKSWLWVKCLTSEPLCGQLSGQHLRVDLQQAGDKRFSLVDVTEAPQNRSF